MYTLPFLEFQSAPHFSSEANPGRKVFLPREGTVSIRASLQQRGEPLARLFWRQGSRRFNPRLTSAARRTDPARVAGALGVVSIRASLQQRGEPPYPAPLLRLQARFNPRLTSAARRTHLCSNTHAAYVVSIRASLQQRGERYKYL